MLYMLLCKPSSPCTLHLAHVSLGSCAPLRLLVTTPNKEYNLNWINPPPLTEDQTVPSPPPINSYPLRNSDHRFEWDRYAVY